MIVVPKSLHPQFTRELRRYLLPHSFDILPYLGRVETRPDFWSAVWTQSKHTLGRRILLATTGVSVCIRRCVSAIETDVFVCKAFEDDGSRAVSMDKTRPASTLRVNPTAAHSRTIYAQSWLFFAIDEAHKVRTQNACFNATIGLVPSCGFAVAMTATPITTSPKVLYLLISVFRLRADPRVARISSISGVVLASATLTALMATRISWSTPSASTQPLASIGRRGLRN